MRFREMKKPKRMARACIQVTLASMAAIIGLAGCGTPPTEVKEANANPDAFLAKNYTLQALRPSYVETLKAVGAPGPTDFKEITFKFDHRYRNIGATEDSVTAPQATYRPLGNGFFQHVRTLENNGFLVNRSYELTFLGALSLKKENAYTNAKLTTFESVVKEVKPFKLDPSKLTLGSKFSVDYGNAFPLQEFNFRWSKVTCTTERLGAASEIHPKIRGSAVWLACNATHEAGGESKFTNVYFAQYGLLLATKYADSRFTAADTVTDFIER